MKVFICRGTLSAWAMLAVAPLGLFGQTRPDFSGTWKMDAARSESAHQDTPIGPVSLAIQQSSATLRLETKRSELHSAKTSTELLTFPLDGTETTNDPDSKMPVQTKAHWDGGKLVIETERVMNGSTVTTTQVLELDAAGKQMTVHKTLTVQHGYQGDAMHSSSGSGTDVFVRTK